MSYQKLKPFIFITIAALFLLLEMGLQVSLSVIAPELVSEFNITAAGIGLIGSFYFYSYTFMQIPCGILLDSISVKKIVGISLALCALGTVLFGFADGIALASLGRMLIGFGSAFAFVAVLYIGAQWFPHKYFALISGLAMVMASLGAIGGESPLAYMVEHIGWRYSLFVLAIIGAVLTILAFILLEDKNQKESFKFSKFIDIFKDIIKILKLKRTWGYIIFAFAIWSPITGFASLWGVPFIQKAYSFSTSKAAFCCSMIWIGVAVGSFMFGWISERIKKRAVVLRIGSLVGLVCSIFVVYFGMNLPLLYITLFGFGVATGGQALIFAVVRDVTDESLVGSAFGILNMAVVASGFIFQPLIGILLKNLHPMVGNYSISSYSLGDYKTALIAIPIVFAVSFIVSTFFIKETYNDN